MNPPPPWSPAEPDEGGNVVEALGPGSLFADRYLIERPLGRGGMGTVYLARHRAMDRLCAIKVLHPRLSLDQEARERFAREARNVSRINHPNVCSVYDFGTSSEGFVYLVMEYIEGRSLGAVLAERGSLGLHQAARVLEPMAAGLDAAHALGIVHRDLKPDNAILTQTQEGESVKLVDFGIAKALETEPQEALTSEGVVVGTPEYMAPEAFAGDAVDHRSDVYSLAMVYYRMVTGTVAHRGKSSRETLSRRLVEPPAPLRVALANAAVSIPDALEAVVAQGLARDPEARPASAGAFAKEIVSATAQVPADGEERELTVLLDAATATGIRSGPPPTVAITRRRVIGGIGVIALALGAVWAAREAGQGDTVAGDPPPAAASDTGVAGAGTPPPEAVPDQPVAPGSPPRAEAAGGNLTAVPPLLPTEEQMLDPDSGGAHRAVAEQIYRDAGRDMAERVQAAFRVGASYFALTQDPERATHWLNVAIELNDSIPTSGVQQDRAKRYRDYLSFIRKREEPNLP